MTTMAPYPQPSPTTPYSHPEIAQYPPGIPPNRYVGGRTPSPTPSEIEATANVFSIKKFLNWRFWARKEWIPWYILGVIVLAATILISVFDKQIVNFLTPAGKWMRDLPFGWLIPIAILFIISFPPLFGHEIVAILVGVIWGLGVGFAIVAAGTFLGEIGNYYAFKYCCRARGEKMEKTSIPYGCLARVVREGGFKVALIIRLSVIPGHFSTAVFSTCGMNIFVFALAAFFSLPKQLITVYLGVILEESGSGGETKKDKLISDVVLGVTILITAVACWWIYREINRVKPAVIYERRKARQVKLSNPAYDLENNSSVALNTRAFASESELPLSVTPTRPAQFQLRQGTGGYAGYGGYGPSYAQGPYGETLDDDERKSTEIVGWETRETRVADMRGAQWGNATKVRHGSDEESEESAATVRHVDAPLPPRLPPPGSNPIQQPHQLSPIQQPYQPNPIQQSYQPSPAVHPQQLSPAVRPQNQLDGGNTPRPQQRFELSDPPVVSHTLQASDSTFGPPHSRSPDQSHYAHSAEPSDVSYTSEYPLTSRHQYEPTDTSFRGGHAAEATDATFYTAAGSPPGSPSSPFADPPHLPPVRTTSPLTSHNKGR